MRPESIVPTVELMVIEMINPSDLKDLASSGKGGGSSSIKKASSKYDRNGEHGISTST